MILWLLLACGADDTRDSGVVTSPPPSTPAVDTATTTSTTPTVAEPPALAEPAAAMDLDPDPSVLHVQLTAAPHTYAIDGETVQGFAYNGQVPGPTLRAPVGGTLRVELTNDVDAPTTIHWHGPRDVPFPMDGVAWMGAPVEPGASFVYEIPLTHAGTFWYHPHFDTARQVDLGLYGALIVEDPTEPTVDIDQVWIFDSFGEHDGAEGHDHGFVPLPGQWTVNGAVQPVLEAGGAVVRARLINVSNTGYLRLDWPDARLLAGDQGLLPEPVPLDDVVLGPGDRIEVELRVGPEDQILTTNSHSLAGPSELGEPVPLLTLRSSGEPPASAPAWPTDDAGPTPDPGRTDIVYVFQGDERTGEWRINGETFPDVTIETLPLGVEAIVEVRNLSPSHHPFHTHGVHFELLSRDGVPPDRRTIEDTLDIGIRETVRLRIEADNLGDWMTHCHILPHAEGGMMTVLRIE